MSSEEFFTLVREHLTEDGVMVVNMNMRGSNEGSINDYLADTIASVFDTVYTADVSGSTNRELFASTSSSILETFQKNKAELDNQNLFQMMERVVSGLNEYTFADSIWLNGMSVNSRVVRLYPYWEKDILILIGVGAVGTVISILLWIITGFKRKKTEEKGA
jgi:ATP phosphoribosyltransferase